MTNVSSGWGSSIKAVEKESLEVKAQIKPDFKIVLSDETIIEIPGEPSPQQWVEKRDELLMLWEASKVKLEAAKADEMLLRKAVVDFSFNPEVTKGTERIKLGNGYEAKAVKKENVKLVNEIEYEGVKIEDAVDWALTKIEEIDDEGKFIAKRLVKWTPDLVAKEYKELPERYKTIIDLVIETTAGASTLEIVAPKGKK